MDQIEQDYLRQIRSAERRGDMDELMHLHVGLSEYQTLYKDQLPEEVVNDESV